MPGCFPEVSSISVMRSIYDNDRVSDDIVEGSTDACSSQIFGDVIFFLITLASQGATLKVPPRERPVKRDGLDFILRLEAVFRFGDNHQSVSGGDKGEDGLAGGRTDISEKGIFLFI